MKELKHWHLLLGVIVAAVAGVFSLGLMFVNFWAGVLLLALVLLAMFAVVFLDRVRQPVPAAPRLSLSEQRVAEEFATIVRAYGPRVLDGGDQR